MVKKKEIKKFEEPNFGEEIKKEIEAPEVKETLEELKEKIKIAEEEAKQQEVEVPEIEPKKTEPIAIIKQTAMGEPGLYQYILEANYLLKLGICDLRQ